MAEEWWAEAPDIIKEDFGKSSFLIKSKATGKFSLFLNIFLFTLN